MRVRPLATLPLRLGLRVQARVNRFTRAHAPALRRALEAGASEATPDELARGYLEVRPHPYALLGHQIASWVGAAMWARDLGLRFAGGPLTREPGRLFALDAVTSAPPLRARRVRLWSVPDERDENALPILRAQVARALRRHANRPVVFRIALDPLRWDQTGASGLLREAVLAGPRSADLAAMEAGPAYVAIHVRRGSDIHAGHHSNASIPRWVAEDWYVGVVRRLRALPELADVEFRVYALGEPTDFAAIAAEGVALHLNGDRDTDLLELAAARLLVMSPSSYAFTAGMLSRGAAGGRVPWWHFVPDTGRWFRLDPDGTIDEAALRRALRASGRW